jgi:hydrogenase expression/formation protein HypD
VAIQLAARMKLPNISFLVSHKIIPPALAILAQDRELAVSGFLLPGHVSAILGADAYQFMTPYKKPGVITGFEPLDILAGIAEAVSMLARGETGVRNAYPRVVTAEGNVKARTAIDTVFEVGDDDWRGIGRLPQSGLKIRKNFEEFDAALKYGITIKPGAMPAGCACGDVLKGKIRPDQCPLFAKGCTPEHPVGPCMVSSEGSCAAYFKYEKNNPAAL